SWWLALEFGEKLRAHAEELFLFVSGELEHEILFARRPPVQISAIVPIGGMEMQLRVVAAFADVGEDLSNRVGSHHVRAKNFGKKGSSEALGLEDVHDERDTVGLRTSVAVDWNLEWQRTSTWVGPGTIHRCFRIDGEKHSHLVRCHARPLRSEHRGIRRSHWLPRLAAIVPPW